MREFFDRYKIVIFLLLALVSGLIFAIAPFMLWKFVIFIPIAILGGYLLFKLFPRSSEEHLTVVRVNGDGSVLITKSAVARSAADAVKVIQEVKYLGCEVENSRTGINILISVKVLGARVVETSEVVKEFVKNLLEEELNVKVNKIDIIVKKVEYALKVRKIDPSKADVITQDDETENIKKSKTNKAIEKADKSVIVPVSEFNSEYDFAVGNEKRRLVVKGGDEGKKQAHATPAYSEANAYSPKEANPVAVTERTPQYSVPHDKTPQYSVPPANSNSAMFMATAATTKQQNTVSYPSAIKSSTTNTHTAVVPTQAPPSSQQQVDLKAELARRKAEREALLNKISSDGNKLN